MAVSSYHFLVKTSLRNSNNREQKPSNARINYFSTQLQLQINNTIKDLAGTCSKYYRDGKILLKALV